MTEFQLSAPIAGPVHTGPTCTWTSPLGEEFTIDYVLIPTAWQDRCRRSSILEELDMGNKNLDHSAYVIEMGWSSQQVIRHGKQEVRGSLMFSDSEQDALAFIEFSRCGLEHQR